MYFINLLVLSMCVANCVSLLFYYIIIRFNLLYYIISYDYKYSRTYNHKFYCIILLLLIILYILMLYYNVLYNMYNSYMYYVYMNI